MAETKIRLRKATALLREDHQKVKKLYAGYEELEDGEREEKADLFRRIQRELEVHAQVEEEEFYPALKQSEDEEAGHLLLEAAEEHRLVKALLKELESLTPGEASFDAKFKVLIDNVLHHAEEEQEELFPLFDELPKDVRDEVSERLAMRKRELAPES